MDVTNDVMSKSKAKRELPSGKNGRVGAEYA